VIARLSARYLSLFLPNSNVVSDTTAKSNENLGVQGSASDPAAILIVQRDVGLDAKKLMPQSCAMQHC
jgi:hypothetical protein